MTAHSGALEEIEGVLGHSADADDVLRQVVSILHARLGRFVRISFVEGDRLVPGPAEGEETETTPFPISFQGRQVAQLEAGEPLSAGDREVIVRVAAIVSPYALVGWDTEGEEWTP